MLESCLRNAKEDMSQTIVSLLLIMKKKPTKHYQEEDFCLGIPVGVRVVIVLVLCLTQVLAYRLAVLKPNTANLRNGNK